jgi:hypothetical protein
MHPGAAEAVSICHHLRTTAALLVTVSIAIVFWGRAEAGGRGGCLLFILCQAPS